METTSNGHSSMTTDTRNDNCPICLDAIRDKKTLKCRHYFCTGCIDSVFRYKPACPVCNTFYGIYHGTQPQGTMTVTRSRQCLPGFDNCGSIAIEYRFPPGIQGVSLKGSVCHACWSLDTSHVSRFKKCVSNPLVRLSKTPF